MDAVEVRLRASDLSYSCEYASVMNYRHCQPHLKLAYALLFLSW